jgi:cyclopropane fatty-acyl-phospholipid synthase-like methyltransferase
MDKGSVVLAMADTPPDGDGYNRGLYFDEVAAVYDRARPGYPDRLVDEILEHAQISMGARILEIGCGSGQATVPFASRGLSMICLEPGENLARLARARLAAFENVEIRTESFEGWPLEPEAFDLIISAKALHWVAAHVRFSKSAQALRLGGSLAVFQNNAVPRETPVESAIRTAVGKNAHIVFPRVNGPGNKELTNTPDFGTLSSR